MVKRLTISETGSKIRSGELSPVQLVKDCLRRIEILNPKLNAFISVMAKEAITEAAMAETEIRNGNWKGPLHGIPVALKDFFDTKGTLTTAAFIHFKNRIPQQDAVVVAQLKAAGAIIIGKTNMHQLGMGTTSLVSYFGSVQNPWNSEYVAGGSSGGSAVAVATGMCHVAIDTDVVGSCRIPAACCGVVGFKATYGSIENTGILEGEPVDPIILKFSHVGITAQCVEDAENVYKILASPQPGNKVGKTKIRLGIVSNYKTVEPVKKAFEASIATFSNAGYAFKEVSVPFEKARFEIENVDRERDLIGAELFKDVDVIVLPTLTELVPSVREAKKKGDMAIEADNTFFCNYFGLPVASIPYDVDKNGLPLGLQVVGASGQESVVFETAFAFQELINWKGKKSIFIL